MFDIAFSELVVIGVVALIVIGPEKLPKVARTVGLLLGRVQRYVNGVKSDISRELRFEELQRLQQEVQQGIRQAESTIHRTGQDLQHEMQQLGDAVQQKEPSDKPPLDVAQPDTANSDATQSSINQSAPQPLDLSLAESAASQNLDNIQPETIQHKLEPSLDTQPVTSVSPKQDNPD